MPQTLAQIPSSSNPSKHYDIVLGDDGTIYCNCWGWKRNRSCKHLAMFHNKVSKAVSQATQAYPAAKATSIMPPPKSPTTLVELEQHLEYIQNIARQQSQKKPAASDDMETAIKDALRILGVDNA